MNGNSCATCRFCISDFSKLGNGFCMRNPPTCFVIPQMSGQMAFASSWPPVQKATGWCGEYHAGLVTDTKDTVKQ